MLVLSTVRYTNDFLFSYTLGSYEPAHCKISLPTPCPRSAQIAWQSEDLYPCTTGNHTRNNRIVCARLLACGQVPEEEEGVQRGSNELNSLGLSPANSRTRYAARGMKLGHWKPCMTDMYLQFFCAHVVLSVLSQPFCAVHVPYWVV